MDLAPIERKARNFFFYFLQLWLGDNPEPLLVKKEKKVRTCIESGNPTFFYDLDFAPKKTKHNFIKVFAINYVLFIFQ